MNPRSSFGRLGPVLACIIGATSGCMFNVVSVTQKSTAFTEVTQNPRRVQLLLEIKAPLGTGFPTWLKTGTRWTQVGKIAEGDVFSTTDQIVTVEASNIHEAYMVLNGAELVGFYLPVEKTFAPTKTNIPLQLKTIP